MQFLYRNPHSFVHVEVKDKTGQTVRWAVEWGAGGQLGRQGVTRETLKPGDHVIIVGNPGRNPEDHRLRMVNITPAFRWLEMGRLVRLRLRSHNGSPILPPPTALTQCCSGGSVFFRRS